MTSDSHKGFRPGVHIAVCQSPVTLAEFTALEVAKQSPLASLSSLELIEIGAVYVNDNRSMNPGQRLKNGDRVRIHTTPRRFTAPRDLADRIVSENEMSILVEKPAQIPSGPLIDNAGENMISFLEDLRGQRFFLTHTLDTESEGLMLIAKSTEAADKISQAFKDGKILRVHAAYVDRPLVLGEYRSDDSIFRVRDCREFKAETHLITENRTSWESSGEPFHVFYRLEIESATARPKEIRAILSKSGSPVLGDRVHGSHYSLTDTKTGKTAMAFKTLLLSADLNGSLG